MRAPACVVPPRASQCSGDGAPFSGMGQTVVLRVSVRATDRAHARAVRASRPASIGVRKERKKAAAPLVSRENRWPLVETRVKNINSRRARLESQRAPRSSHLPRWHARPRASLQGLKKDRARGRSAVSTAPAKKVTRSLAAAARTTLHSARRPPLCPGRDLPHTRW